jgi:hypothetical protein
MLTRDEHDGLPSTARAGSRTPSGVPRRHARARTPSGVPQRLAQAATAGCYRTCDNPIRRPSASVLLRIDSSALIESDGDAELVPHPRRDQHGAVWVRRVSDEASRVAAIRVHAPDFRGDRTRRPWCRLPNNRFKSLAHGWPLRKGPFDSRVGRERDSPCVPELVLVDGHRARRRPSKPSAANCGSHWRRGRNATPKALTVLTRRVTINKSLLLNPPMPRWSHPAARLPRAGCTTDRPLCFRFPSPAAPFRKAEPFAPIFTRSPVRPAGLRDDTSPRVSREREGLADARFRPSPRSSTAVRAAHGRATRRRSA